MKVTVDFDMTPEEARKMLGLPEVAPLQEEMMARMRERMSQHMDDMSDPELLFKKLFPVGVQSMENFQNIFSEFMSASSAATKKKAD